MGKTAEAATHKLEEGLERPADAKLCLRAALDGCQKPLNGLWPTGKIGAGCGEEEKPVLIPRGGGWSLSLPRIYTNRDGEIDPDQ